MPCFDVGNIFSVRGSLICILSILGESDEKLWLRIFPMLWGSICESIF